MIRTIADLELLRESVDVEAKAAQGRYGQGDGSLEVLGLANPEKVRTELWNGLNNPQKVNANLLGEGAIESLQEMFGAGFAALEANERLALATAFLEGQVNNARLQQITGLHAADLTRLLGKLVAGGYLSRDGRGRGSHYRLGTEATELGSEGSESSTEPSELPAGLRESLEQAFADLRGSRKAPKERVRQAILEACRHGFIPLRELARLLGRKPDTLRLLYLPELLASGELEARYPEHPKHPNQAYRTREGA